MITVRKALLVVALLALALLPAPSATARSTGDGRCPASASICTYRLPDTIQAARDACYRVEAAERGIPSARDAYVAWWNSASASTRSNWTRAFKACQDRNQLPGGKWDWESMVYVGSR